MVKRKTTDNPSLGEMARGTGRAVKGVGVRAKGWYQRRQAAAAAERKRQRDPEAVEVFRGRRAPNWIMSTSRQGELATDSRPDGKWYRKIAARLGAPVYPWDRLVPEDEDEWYDLDEYMNEYYLSWPDGVHATLDYSRDDPEVLRGRWNIGASDEHAAEAMRRVRALFKTKKATKKRAAKKKPSKRTRNPRERVTSVRALVAKALK